MNDDDDLIDVIPFRVRCHGAGLRMLNSAPFVSSTGREMKLILQCPVCNQGWDIMATMTRFGNPKTAARQAAYRARVRQA